MSSISVLIFYLFIYWLLNVLIDWLVENYTSGINSEKKNQQQQNVIKRFNIFSYNKIRYLNNQFKNTIPLKKSIFSSCRLYPVNTCEFLCAALNMIYWSQYVRNSKLDKFKKAKNSLPVIIDHKEMYMGLLSYKI